jgi:hypothetical protein
MCEDWLFKIWAVHWFVLTSKPCRRCFFQANDFSKRCGFGLSSEMISSSLLMLQFAVVLKNGMAGK